MKTTDVLTDLHCHILPGIDDGAQNYEVSKALLLEQKKQGVEQIVFTPHFWSWEKSTKDFLQGRYNAAKEISGLLDELGIRWNAGAEVRLTPELIDLDMSNFQFVDTDYLLLEWPFTQQPLYGEDFVYSLLEKGIRVIFAHIERYEYFWRKPEVLDDYINHGVICQINPGILLHEETRKQALHRIRDGYIHILSSDAHNMDRRPPRLKEAYEVIEEELGRDYAVWFMQNGNAVFFNEEIKPIEIKKKKKSIFGFFGK
ncbi:MAG: hypothetical protein IJ875_04540 [Solobacterium sp.]|nr:hypothetical protein [Solobacterium sp.]